MKVLIVDDSATMRRIIVNTLQNIGITEVVEAADGRQALAAIDDSIELVITDWNMPEMGGLDLVKALKADPARAAVPILMVTTRGAKEDLVQALQAGVSNYVLKPFTPELLKEKIDEVKAPA